MNICDIKDINCTGCAACYSVCGSKVIIMSEDIEGFKYPKITNGGGCSNCNLCIDVCPALHIKDEEKAEDKQECYAILGSDDVRIKSSSGGFFTYISEYVIKLGGYVSGAAFDDKLYLSHKIVNNINDLDALKKSKYIQSDINDNYKNIKKLLKQDKYVLFTGTPCQVAGLKSFLRKEYEKLITIDLVCHGVPPQKLFHKYLQEEFSGKQIISYDFRDKENGWNTITECIKTNDKIYKRKFYSTIFGKAFVETLSLRKCCGKCDYTNLNRVGDITIGDFWGIEKYSKKLKDKKGVSLILLNSNKGVELFDKIKDKFKKCRKIPIEYAVNGQPHLNQHAFQHLNRDKFFKLINETTFKDAYEKSINSKENNVAIVNFSYEWENIGAVLTGFALQEYVKSHYDKNIFNIQYFYQKTKNKYFDNFRKKYLKETPQINRGKEFIKYASICEKILFGSDQVFAYRFVKEKGNVLLGALAPNDTCLCSVAASFGGDNIETLRHKKVLPLYSNALKRFSKNSVRESSGMDIFTSLNIPEVSHILDPVFLLDADDYKKIANEKEEKYNVFVYKLSNDKKGFLYKDVANLGKKLGYNSIKEIVADDRNEKIEDWLYYISVCDIVITSSFHGAAYAILFKKEFIFINASKSGHVRISSLNKMLGIENRVYSKIDDIDIDYIKNNKIEYMEVNRKLTNLIDKTKQYIDEVMSYQLTNNEIESKKIYSKYLLKYYKKLYIKACLKYGFYFLKMTVYKLSNKKRKAEKYDGLRLHIKSLKDTLKFLKQNSDI